MNCHPDFLKDGIAALLSEKFSFDLIGMTTMVSACQGRFDACGLALSVLTSDDVHFAAAGSSSLTAGDYRKKLEYLYARAKENLTGEPSFCIVYFPTSTDIGGAEMLKALDGICGGIPIWGGLTTGVDSLYTENFTFCNKGEMIPGAAALVLVSGRIEPDFVVTSIPKRNIREARGLITASDGCLLQEVNGIPALKYFEGLGINISRDNVATMPLMVDYKDGPDTVALGMVAVKEGGALLCGGEIPGNGTIALGEITRKGILDTARVSLEKAMKNKRNGLLMLPCVSRYMMLAPQQEEEIRLISGMIAGQTPYMLGYCGGEICPVRDKNGNWRNRFHNYTFSACIV